MKIKLAGYNVETEVLEQLNQTHNMVITPEIFSAAYARISRSSKDVTTLRNLARSDVEKARRSNKNIIFDMGHHSVAEHAVFNFDLIGISRLALEEIEKFRLVSYTEKSQRYVTLKGDHIIPEEIKNNNLRQLFKDTVTLQNEFYKKSFSILKEHILKKSAGVNASRPSKRDMENMAKEDARYILSLATEGQVGLTINARNLEHLFRRFAMNRRIEVQKIGEKMFDLVKNITPSILLFPAPSCFEKKIDVTLKEDLTSPSHAEMINTEPEIIHFTANGDDMILATFFAVYNSINYKKAHSIIKRMDAGKKINLYKKLFDSMDFFDTPPREFELPDITFQAVVSASNFAQLKRHRIATHLSGEYNIECGNVIPKSFGTVNLKETFLNIIEHTNQVYLKLKDIYNEAADYILTNSHCRMVIVKMNLRELYHFSRLRDDEHAQWDIRNLAEKLLEKVKKIMPYSTLLLCGKSKFYKIFEDIYKKKPKCTL